MSDLTKLESDLDRALSVRTFRKESRAAPFFWSAEFFWLRNVPYAERAQTLVNTAPGQIRMYRMWYEVATVSDLSYLTPQPHGVSNSNTTDAAIDVLDFEWQITMSSSGARVGIPGHNVSDPFVSSTALETFHMARRWSFAPLILGLNESMEINVRPTLMKAFQSPYILLRLGFEGSRAYA